MHCSGCGKEIPDSIKFCPYCGKKVGQTELDFPQTDREEEIPGSVGTAPSSDDLVSPSDPTPSEPSQPSQQDVITDVDKTNMPTTNDIDTASDANTATVTAASVETVPEASSPQKAAAQNPTIKRLVELVKTKKSIVIGIAVALVFALVFGVTEALKVTVSFNGNGSDKGFVEEEKVFKGSTLQLPESTYTREGYTFVGWSTDFNSEEAQFSPGDEIDAQGDAVFFAVWDPITCHVTFDGNGQDSGSMETLDVDYGVPFEVPESDFKRAWYVCKGWATEPDAEEPTVTSGTSANVEGDVTLYAVWEPDGDSIVKAMEVRKESMIADNGSYVMVAFVSSSCDLNVQLTATLTAYDASNKEVGTKKNTIKVIAKDERIPIYEVIEDGGATADHFECELAFDGETGRNPVQSSVAVSQFSDKDGELLVMLKNHSDRTVEDAYVVCLGYIDGELAFAAKQGIGSSQFDLPRSGKLDADESRTIFVSSEFFNEDYKDPLEITVGPNNELLLNSGRRCYVYIRS